MRVKPFLLNLQESNLLIKTLKLRFYSLVCMTGNFIKVTCCWGKCYKKGEVMKRLWLVVGLLVFTAGMSPVFAGPKSWDKKIPKDQKVTLAYADTARIEKIDGEEKKLGPLPLAFPGAGSEKKPKNSLVIQAGERTLSVSYNDTLRWTETKDIKFTFLPGHTYHVKIGQDDEKMTAQMEADGARGIGAAVVSVAMGNYPLKLEIIDITKKK